VTAGGGKIPIGCSPKPIDRGQWSVVSGQWSMGNGSWVVGRGGCLTQDLAGRAGGVTGVNSRIRGR
jgi:hypothetical protein